MRIFAPRRSLAAAIDEPDTSYVAVGAPRDRCPPVPPCSLRANMVVPIFFPPENVAFTTVSQRPPSLQLPLTMLFFCFFFFFFFP